MRRSSKQDGDVFSEFKLNSGVNKAFMAIIQGLRGSFFLAGLRWPAGGSRIVVNATVP